MLFVMYDRIIEHIFKGSMENRSIDYFTFLCSNEVFKSWLILSKLNSIYSKYIYENDIVNNLKLYTWHSTQILKPRIYINKIDLV